MAEPALVTLRLPIPWTDLGFPPAPRLGPTTLVEGDIGWAWEGAAPRFPIPGIEPVSGEPVPGWTTDHVVLLTADLDGAVATMSAAGAAVRLRMEVRGRPTGFFRVGTVLEVIQSPVRRAAVFGVALAAEEALETVMLRWRASGHEVTDPRAAIQPGRRIITVRGLEAGLAVMSPDRAV